MLARNAPKRFIVTASLLKLILEKTRVCKRGNIKAESLIEPVSEEICLTTVVTAGGDFELSVGERR